MRLHRIPVAAMVATALVAAGCSSGTSPSDSKPSGTPSSSPSASSSSTTPPSSAQRPLDQSTCLDISFAKDNLMVAQKPEDARRFADTLEKYGPTDPVKAAIEHFVTTVGAQPNDPGLDADRDLITGWLKQICPGVNP